MSAPLPPTPTCPVLVYRPECELAPIRSQRRRVTFSTRVAECPPPEDSNYPASSMTLLKSEVVVAPKLKKRGRDSKKALSAAERASVAAACRLFLSRPLAKETRAGFVRLDDPVFGESSPALPGFHVPVPGAGTDFQLFSTPLSPHPGLANEPLAFPAAAGARNGPLPDDPAPAEPPNLQVRDAKWFLERLAKFYKFTVSYSDFPKTSELSQDAFFSIVTIGLDKTVLLPGTGPDEEQAHLDAAFHGLEALTGIDKSP